MQKVQPSIKNGHVLMRQQEPQQPNRVGRLGLGAEQRFVTTTTLAFVALPFASPRQPSLLLSCILLLT